MPGFPQQSVCMDEPLGCLCLVIDLEGLGGALIQAMACGTPVVSTDCPSGPAEILEDGKWGRLVPVGDVRALACAIMLTVDAKSHPDVRQRAAFFSDKRSVDDYLDVCFPHGAVNADRTRECV